MSGYTVTKATSTYSLYGAYRCTKCGKTVRFKKEITAKSSDLHYGAHHDKATLEGYKGVTSGFAYDMLTSKIKETLIDVERGNYIDCGLKCNCSCGKVEPWASFHTSFKQIFHDLSSYKALIVILIGMILGGIYCFKVEPNPYTITMQQQQIIGIVLFAITAILLIYFGINNKRNDKLQEKCYNLEDDNRPHLFLTEDEREAFVAQYYEDEFDTAFYHDNQSKRSNQKERKDPSYYVRMGEGQFAINCTTKNNKAGELSIEQSLALAEQLYKQVCFEIRDIEAASISDSESSRHADSTVHTKRLRDMSYLITLIVRPPRPSKESIESFISTYINDVLHCETSSLISKEKQRLKAMYCDVLSNEINEYNRPVDSLSEFAAQYSLIRNEYNDSYYRVISAYKCAILAVFPEVADSSSIEKVSIADNAKKETVSCEQSISNDDSHAEKTDTDRTEIKFCKKCGFKLLSDSTFCSHCGAKIE